MNDGKTITSTAVKTTSNYINVKTSERDIANRYPNRPPTASSSNVFLLSLSRLYRGMAADAANAAGDDDDGK